jgi:CRP-like cAMP-binding protein
MSYVEILKRAQILQGLSAEQLEGVLAANQIATFQHNEAVFEEDSCGREMYIVLEGEVAVEVDPAKLGTVEKGSTEKQIIRKFGPGESFGEVAVVDQRPRDAAITATQDNTKLLVLPPYMFDNVPQAQVIMHNITRDLSDKLRGSNTRIIQSMLSSYFLTALVEQLSTEAQDCNPIIPLQKMMVIRSPENFILSGPGRLIPYFPEKEAIEISFFAEPAVLERLIGPGIPSPAVAFNALFSIIRSGSISERIAERTCRYELVPTADRRDGKLMIWKTIDDHTKPYTLEWQIKGARYNPETNTSHAHLFLYIYADEAESTRSQAQQIINAIDMPVQKYFYQTLPPTEADKSKFRVIIIHHRSHETARTLQTLRDLGYQIDSFIGIPYGDVNWDYITMLDHASDHNYMSLKLITHPTEPTRYQFDFRQSSFLETQAEQDLLTLYEDPAITGDYLTAMQTLATYRLEKAILKCRERGERLIVYEDGGYIVAKIYEIYKNADHRLHALIKAAINDGTIVGVVEVTVAGERKNLQMIEENQGRALLPVLSNARSDIKAMYEAMGVGEAVIHASATSLGRLGLPTFQMRRVAVIGGNGAIGTRLVEQLTMLHNSTANIFAVDPSDRPFSMEIDGETLPYAATRLKYRRLPRYKVSDRCLPVILDAPFSAGTAQPNPIVITQAIRTFLADPRGYQELALTNSYPLDETELSHEWSEAGYRQVDVTPLANEAGVRYLLEKGDIQKVVTLLAWGTVLTFDNVSRPLRNGINTVIGSTGYPVFSAKNLDDFLARPSQGVDELVLISASSKDYEFRKAIDFLNILLKIQVNAPVPAETRLGWLADFYKDEMSFLQGEDFAPLQKLLAAPLNDETFEAFVQAEPALAEAMGLTGTDSAQRLDRLAGTIAERIRRSVSIRKEIRPDIGSIYHLTIKGEVKRVVLLADGLVVNFFARHEKGVKTEFIDPIVTMQVLSLVKLCTTSIEPGLYKMDVHLRPEDMATFWAAINENCQPLKLN